MKTIFLIKVILSVLVGFALVYPFLNPVDSGGVLNEINMFGPIGASVIIVAFLLLVFMYAFDLSRCFKLIKPVYRQATPESVWLMFLLPYNFIEDFFIIINLARSLRLESDRNPELKSLGSYGLISGVGWCTSQILSLIPNNIGSLAGFFAIVFWAWHWSFIRRTNRLLSAAESMPE
jgi:hypothetical protein